MKKLYTKTFDHKGQMINYYNKVRANEKITFCCCCFEVGKGWVVSYQY